MYSIYPKSSFFFYPSFTGWLCSLGLETLTTPFLSTSESLQTNCKQWIDGLRNCPAFFSSRRDRKDLLWAAVELLQDASTGTSSQKIVSSVNLSHWLDNKTLFQESQPNLWWLCSSETLGSSDRSDSDTQVSQVSLRSITLSVF